MSFKHNIVLPFALLACILHPILLPAQTGTLEGGRRNDFKFTMLSLGSGSSRFTYERAFSPLNSAEFTLGFIGVGWDFINNSDPHGLLLKFAFKWRLAPQPRDHSWLAGFYVKPELVFAAFNHNYSQRDLGSQPSNYHDRTRQVALLAECGYQLVFNWFVFDLYGGLGPSFGTGNDFNYYHSFMLFPADGWLAFTAGYRIGIAF